MGEIADAMLNGELCEGCGGSLGTTDECDCSERGIPMYCSVSCAKSRGASKEQVCKHE